MDIPPGRAPCPRPYRAPAIRHPRTSRVAAEKHQELHAATDNERRVQLLLISSSIRVRTRIGRADRL